MAASPDSPKARVDMNASTTVGRMMELVREQMSLDIVLLLSLEGNHLLIEHAVGPAARFGIVPGSEFRPNENFLETTPPEVFDPSLAPGEEVAEKVSEAICDGIGPCTSVVVTSPEGELQRVLSCVYLDRSRPPASRSSIDLAAEMLSQIVAHEDVHRRHQRVIKARIDTVIKNRMITTLFQPIVEASTGAVVGAEALSRFPKSNRGPDVWFAEAASVGMGVDLELAAMEIALSQLPNIADHIYLSLNASPDTIIDPRLLNLVATSQPRRLVIEITEHAVVTDYSALTKALRNIRNIGARIAVDDVGAGFSSFTHIRELEPDIIKIDRSIVSNIHEDPARRVITSAIGDVSKDLGAKAVAEGIEVQEELDVLMAIGIQYAQGYFLAKPGPIEKFGDKIDVCAHETEAVTTLPEDPEDESGDEERFGLAMQRSSIGSALISTDGEIMQLNPALAQLLAYSMHDLQHTSIDAITHPDDRDIDARLIEECLTRARDSYRIDKRYIKQDGTLVWAELTVSLVRNFEQHPMYFISQIQEIREQTSAGFSLAIEQRVDPLTGALNRISGTLALEGLHRRDSGYFIYSCNVTGFRQLNLNHGRRSGDLILVSVARTLAAMTESPGFVARWGSHEFLLVVPSHGAATPPFSSEWVTNALASRANENAPFPTVAVGYASFDPDSPEHFEAVLQRAEDGARSKQQRQAA